MNYKTNDKFSQNFIEMKLWGLHIYVVDMYVVIDLFELVMNTTFSLVDSRLGELKNKQKLSNQI